MYSVLIPQFVLRIDLKLVHKALAESPSWLAYQRTMASGNDSCLIPSVKACSES